MSSKIKKVLKYAKSLVGLKRCDRWKMYEMGTNKAPWWTCNKKLSSIKEIKKQGADCAGFATLLRRYAGLPVDKLGGTMEWFNYLKKNKRLKKFNYKRSYPAGTLLLRDYNTKDSGHVAVIYEENKKGVLYSSLIHSVGWIDGTKTCRGVKIDKSVGQSHFFHYNGTTNTGHYTHICLPEDWLLKE